MRTTTTLMLALCLSGAAQAAATTYSFAQGGYAEGASISGTFVAEDLDGNNQLNSLLAEVQDFSLSFSGNSLVEAFTLSFADLITLVADLDGGPIGARRTVAAEAIGANSALYSFLAGPGLVDACGSGAPCAFVQRFGGGFDASTEPVNFQVIPVPGSLALLVSALGVLGARRGRNR